MARRYSDHWFDEEMTRHIEHRKTLGYTIPDFSPMDDCPCDLCKKSKEDIICSHCGRLMRRVKGTRGIVFSCVDPERPTSCEDFKKTRAWIRDEDDEE